MTGRLIGTVIALCGVGLIAAMLVDDGHVPAAAFSRSDKALLILGVGLCVGGLCYVIKDIGKSVPAGTTPAALAKSRRVSAYRADAERGILAETAILVCAILIAVALGIASGLWINRGWASSSSSALSPSAAQSPTVVHATEQTTPASSTAIENQPGDSDLSSSTVAKATPLPESDEPSHGADEPSSAGTIRPVESAGEMGRGEHATGADPATTTAGDESPSGKTAGVPGRTPSVEARAMGGRAPGRIGPCTLFADASALTIRSGGGSNTITLKLNGAESAARINASTPNWSDIVVFAEPHASVNGGWVKYSIRSVSKRAGIYRVNFTTPCGAKSIAVTVTH